MQIIKAADHGTRMVLVVCHNPDAPHWVHRQGDVVKDGENRTVLGEDGAESLIVATTEHMGSDGATCHQCRNNWDITEVVLDGLEGYRAGIDGQLVRFSDEELAGIAFRRAAKPPIPVMLDSLEGLNS